MANDKEIDEQIASSYFKNGDLKKSFELIIQLYSPLLYAHIYNMVGSHQDTDDILQNTFLKARKYFSGFNQLSRFGTWLYRIATNESYTFLENRKKRNFREPTHEFVIDARVQESFLETKTIEAKLKFAIDKLPLKQKQVFILRYFDEKSYKEMSEILQTSEGALKASFHLAVKKITETLQKD